MEHTIEGILIRFNEKMKNDRRTIHPDAFRDCDGISVPVTSNAAFDSPIGIAKLTWKEDGIYYVANVHSDEGDKLVQKIFEDNYRLAMYANHLITKNNGLITKGTIHHIFFAPTFDSLACVLKVDDEEIKPSKISFHEILYSIEELTEQINTVEKLINNRQKQIDKIRKELAKLDEEIDKWKESRNK